MDPISQVNPLLDALRKQLAENIERLRKSGKLAAAGTARSASAPAATGAESLEAALGRKLAAIDRRSPEGRSAATRALVESALVAEFGQGLLSDPAFGDMVADISASLREDATIREQLDRALDAV